MLKSRISACFSAGTKLSGLAVAVPIFTLFNFFPLQTYFYAKSHLLSMFKSKKATAEEKSVIGPRLPKKVKIGKK